MKNILSYLLRKHKGYYPILGLSKAFINTLVEQRTIGTSRII